MMTISLRTISINKLWRQVVNPKTLIRLRVKIRLFVVGLVISFSRPINMVDLVVRKTKIYVYSRVSSDKQVEDGSGMNRQESSDLLELALGNYENYDIEKIKDEGVSAYHNKNITEGELGKFIDRCKNGEVEAGSILMLEALDRFTRTPLTEAQKNLNYVLDNNVIIHEFLNGTIHRKNELTGAIHAVISLYAANQYSEKLAHRVIFKTLERIEAIEEGKVGEGKDEEGHTLAIKSAGQNKWWSDCSSGYVKKHKDHFKAARKIVELMLKGWGNTKILDYLNENYPPPRRAKNRNIKGWGLNIIRTFHLGNSLVGEKLIEITDPSKIQERNEDKDKKANKSKYTLKFTIPDYYPPVCTQKELDDIREIKSDKQQSKSPNKKHIGIFTGLRAAYCEQCGASIQAFKSKAKTKYEAFRYKCSGKSTNTTNCSNGTFDSRIVELALINTLMMHFVKPEKDENRFAELKKEIENLEAQKRNLIDTVRLVGPDEDIAKSIQRVKSNIEDRESQLNQMIQDESYDYEAFKAEISNKVIDYTQTELREEIRKKIGESVKNLTFNCEKESIKNLVIKIAITLINGLKIAVFIIDGKYLLVYKNEKMSDFESTQKYAVGLNFYGIDKHKNKIELREPYKYEDLVDCYDLIKNSSFISDERKSGFKQAIKSIKPFLKLKPPVDASGHNINLHSFTADYRNDAEKLHEDDYKLRIAGMIEQKVNN